MSTVGSGSKTSTGNEAGTAGMPSGDNLRHYVTLLHEFRAVQVALAVQDPGHSPLLHVIEELLPLCVQDQPGHLTVEAVELTLVQGTLNHWNHPCKVLARDVH